jgi:hypothetical protein
MKVFDKLTLLDFLKELEEKANSKEVRKLIADAISDILEMNKSLKDEYAENEDIFLGDVFEDIFRDKLGFDY